MSRWSDRKAAQLRAPQWRPRRSPGLLAPVLAAVVALAAAVAWYVAAGRPNVPAAEAPASAKTATQPDDGAAEPVLTLSAAVQRQNGIETAPLRRRQYQEQMRAYATVLDTAALTALDNRLADARAQVAIAEARLAAAKAAYGRAQLLFRNQQNVSKAEMQSAEAAFRTDQAGLAAAEAQRRNLAATAVQEWGAVLGKDLAANGPLTARLIARQSFLVQIALPPGTMLREPPASAAIEAASGARVPVQFVSAAARVDPKFQGAGYLYIASADAGVLPGMDVPAFLPDGKAAEGALVPASAVVWWQGRAWAYLRSGAETFARRAIPTGMPAPDGSGGYIAPDLPRGGQIVVQGAQLLLSQEFRSQIDVED